MTVRTRIAPSPTGELHIGHLRTILYDYALAKKHNGQFILRIEDTDRNRFVEGSMERTLQVIKDYGFSWDEGPEVGGPHEPYLQSQRLEIYKQHAEKLVEQGNAYYCFCTPERLASVREEQQKQGLPKTSYDKYCRNLSSDEVKQKLSEPVPHVIRLKIPENEKLIMEDAIHGKIEFDSSEVDDAVILKSDGYPTYHLAAMVDDHLMSITHVLRGIDWMPSAPIHVFIYKSFGWDMPVFAHLPNLKEIGSSQKLSKRFGAVSCVEFLEQGYLPQAVVNFLMFLGWNPGTDREIYSLKEFTEDFSLEKVQKSDLVAFDREKLLWFNGNHIRDTKTEDLLDLIDSWAKRFSVNLPDRDVPVEKRLSILVLVQERLKTLAEYIDSVSYFYEAPEVDIDLLLKQTKDINKTCEIIQNYFDVYRALDSWNVTELDEISHSKLNEFNYKPRDAFMTLRVALSGQTATPPLFDVMGALGREETLKRLSDILTKLDQ